MEQRNAFSGRAGLFFPGQRWISTSEPELGLGTIVSCGNRRIEISFATHAAVRIYAFDSAPLQRIVFSAGNTIEDMKGRKYVVSSIEEEAQSGLVTYRCGAKSIREDALCDTIAFSTPPQRLAAGIADDICSFPFRAELLQLRTKIDSSAARGFSGGRIDLIPHQLYIAQRAASRAEVRVLLADETGLGKTIEACLILHRRMVTGQVGRALVLVPDALVHQWFVELLRRFNLTSRLLSDDYEDEFEETHEEEVESGEERFDEDPLWICSISKVAGDKKIARQIAGTEWDMVIVDEAHHISSKDPLFGLLGKLASSCGSIILLSATPEQFGREGHLERLRLLDPHRYREAESQQIESQRLRLITSCIEERHKTAQSVIGGDTMITLSDELYTFLVQRQEKSVAGESGFELPRTMTISHLIDLFGAGRAYFRNTRRTISGFPERIASIVRLDRPDDPQIDPHVKWLAGFLRRHPRRKVLVITSTIDAATSVREGVQRLISVDAGIFHEEMTLLQRDRQAAWFAEENGARLLVCNESGSEGRNFQFCSDLVLLDLPWNPELLEQRIGRLDRIGQRNSINIHVPVLEGSTQEALVRWYHEGVGALEKNVPAAATVFAEMAPRLRSVVSGADNSGADTLDKIISDTQRRTAELTAELFNQRDFLLEFASNDPAVAGRLIESISRESSGIRLEPLMEKLLSHFGIKLEEAGANRSALLTEYCTDHAFPLPRSERPVVTYDRATACIHDNVEFLTIDHPMVTGGLDLYLSSASGTSSFALWNDPQTTEMLLETLWVTECIAPPRLRMFRFFTSEAMRLVVNHRGELVTDSYPPVLLDLRCRNGPVDKLVAQKRVIEITLPSLLSASETWANRLMEPAVKRAASAITVEYAAEQKRLSTLKAQGAPVSDGEIKALDKEMRELEKRLSAGRVRLDALRLIRRGPVAGEQV